MRYLARIIGLPILLGFLFIGVYLYVYLGGWRDIEVSQTVFPEMHLLYVEHKGPYHQIEGSIERVEKWAKENGIACPKTFGEFLDDPSVVDPDRLRSNAGCVLHQTVTPSDGLLFRTQPSLLFVTAEFSGSPAIGPWKVYPKMTEYAETHRLVRASNVFEVYTLLGDGKMSTRYLWPISGQ